MPVEMMRECCGHICYKGSFRAYGDTYWPLGSKDEDDAPTVTTGIPVFQAMRQFGNSPAELEFQALKKARDFFGWSCELKVVGDYDVWPVLPHESDEAQGKRYRAELIQVVRP